MSRGALVERAARALAERAKRIPLAQQFSDRFALPQLYERYRKNLLTHGLEFLQGDEEIVYVGEHSPAPLAWRSIPAEGAHSLSRTTVSMSEQGHVVMKGNYGGSMSELQMLPGVTTDTSAPAVGLGACGMASTRHWQLDFSQHHWIELTMRSDHRLYEVVVQYDGYFEGSHRLYRCTLPQGPKPQAQKMTGGAYEVLGIDGDADADTIQRAYKKLAMEMHPDRGGDEEQFKLISKAFALLSNPERRSRYDRMGADEQEPELSALSDWRTIKVPFTAFKDRSFYEVAEQVATVYVLVCDQNPGPFSFELGEMKVGRCRNGTLDSANFSGSKACEQGHCACGYYDGMRIEPFTGPLEWPSDGSFPTHALQFGFAEHHGPEE